jgi:hypothetical protein
MNDYLNRRKIEKTYWFFYKGYAQTNIDGSVMQFHRILMNNPINHECDINKQKYDNRCVTEYIRVVSDKINMRNKACETITRLENNCFLYTTNGL